MLRWYETSSGVTSVTIA